MPRRRERCGARLRTRQDIYESRSSASRDMLLQCLKVSMLLACACGLCFGQDNPAGIGYGVFRIYCAPCHGFRAQGGRGPDLSRGVFRSGEQDAISSAPSPMASQERRWANSARSWAKTTSAASSPLSAP